MKLNDMSAAQRVQIATRRYETQRESLEPRLQTLLDRTPDSYKKLYARVLSGNATLRETIRAKCYECCGFEDARQRTAECAATTCPLHRVRPGA